MNPDHMPKVIAEVQNWVRIIFFSVLKFYRINLQSPEGSFNCDFRKDLLLNMITSLVMMDQTYSIIMNIILQASAGRVKQISKNMASYRFKVNLEKLGVSNYFHFNTAFRDQVIRESKLVPEEERINFESVHEKSVDLAIPFERTIAALKEIPEVNSPMSKLEYIFQVFNTLMISEIDEFWMPAGEAIN